MLCFVMFGLGLSLAGAAGRTDVWWLRNPILAELKALVVLGSSPESEAEGRRDPLRCQTCPLHA